jgi:hypothetical protein
MIFYLQSQEFPNGCKSRMSFSSVEISQDTKRKFAHSAHADKYIVISKHA